MVRRAVYWVSGMEMTIVACARMELFVAVRFSGVFGGGEVRAKRCQSCARRRAASWTCGLWIQPCGMPVTRSGLVVVGVESEFERSVAASLGEREESRERR